VFRQGHLVAHRHAQSIHGRAIVALHLNDFASATGDLEKVMSFDRKFDYQRASGLLAYCYSQTGQAEKSGAPLPRDAQ